MSRFDFGNNKGNEGACDGLGGNMPCRLGYPGKPLGKNGEGPGNNKNGFVGVVIPGDICCIPPCW